MNTTTQITDIGDKCVVCLQDTSPGAGRWVNRVPATTDTLDGYLCAECQAVRCDRCQQLVVDDWEPIGNELVCGDCV
jgi:hypothetical protein